MCGIAGVAGPGGDPALVERMCAAMHHRGPDDRQVRTHADAALGIARLAVVDVDTGRQPLVAAGGEVTVVGNGEIYDHLEHRAALVARGHRFRTGSDVEVVAHLYEEEGIDAVARLNGMFALAVHDARTGEVHLVRDRIGVKPLYWTQVDGQLRFASELTALLVDPAVPRTVDPEGVAELLTLSHLPAPRTPLAGVRALPPATVLTWRAGRVRERRWWHWPVPDTSGADVDRAAVGARVRELVVDAVRLQLRADVPVGVLLSGGIDSTAVLWAARELGADVPAWCVDFDEPDGDTRYARLAARALGAELVERRLDAVDAAQELPRLAARLPAPLGDPAVLPSLAVCGTAARDVTVLLSGTGADEIWGGYGRYVLPATPGRGADDVPTDDVYVDELSVHPEAEVRAALGLPAGRPVADRLRAALATVGPADPAAARMHLDGTLSLPAALLPLLDTSSMAHSLEGRVPLLDHRLVELAAALPGPVRIPGGDLKGLFREALRGHLPDAVLDRRKRGFAPPLADWTARRMADHARRLLRASGGLGDVVDADVARGWLAPGAAPAGLRALRTWVLIVTDLWWRAHLSGGLPAVGDHPATGGGEGGGAGDRTGDLAAVVAAVA